MGFGMIGEKRFAKIIKNIHALDGKSAPISIQAAINDNCFSDCIMCSHPQKPKKFSVSGEEWCEFLKECKKLGLESVCYSGGDPFAHKDLNMIMSMHTELKIKFGFITTGYVPRSINWDLLKFASWIRVSLDAINPESYAKVRGLIPVGKVLSCVDRMIDEGIEVGLCPTVHHYNRNDIFDVLDYAIEKGLYVGVKTAYPGTIDLSGVDWDRIRGYGKLFDDAGLELRVYDGKSYESFNRCSAVFYQLFIDSKGDVYPCCTLGGDVDLTPSGNSLCNISDGILKIIGARNEFSGLGSKDRPNGCKVCIGRLTEINHICEIDSGDNFY